MAAREGLGLTTVLGDMRDLGAFADASFDLVFHPVSNVFCPELAPVWRESFRVLRPGGTLLSGFMNPDVFIFDMQAMERRGSSWCGTASRSTRCRCPEAERAREFGLENPIEYSHTMTEQIGGQLAAGFVITGFQETPHHADATARYLPGYYATRAVKPA